jgi:ATP-binding cassette subfamily B protein
MRLKNSSSKNFGLSSLLPFFAPYKIEVALAVLALLVTTLMVLLFGKVVKYLIDLGFVKSDNFFLTITLLAFVAAVLVLALAGYYRSSLINAVAEKVICDLRKKIYNHIIRVSAEFFELTKIGDVLSRLTVDSVVLYNVFSSTLSFLLRNFLLFCGGIFFLFLTSCKLSLISLAMIFIAVLPIFLLGRKVKKISGDSQENLALVGSHIEETLSHAKTIQAYCCEEKEVRNFSKLVDSSLQSSLQRIRLKALMVASVIALAFGTVAVVLWIGGRDVLSGKITSGELSSFIFYSIVSATSLAALGQIAGQLQSASAAAKRIFELLAIESPVKEAKNLIEFFAQKNITIEFRNVDFSYPSRSEIAVLKNFSLKIKPGERLAVVGASGSGKSTLLQILLRFYDVNSGEVLLNGVDIRSLSFANLRQNFAYISQEPFIFSGTVFENIAYADLGISRQQVEKIIDENESLHFIKKLPQGLDTSVGEKGIKLSGGERQRISLARAILKDAPVLLLDEATSALDNQNEQVVNRILQNLPGDKTVITIAHKLSSVIDANQIIFLHDGKIVETGSHQELMVLNGFYKKMYENKNRSIL